MAWLFVSIGILLLFPLSGFVHCIIEWFQSSILSLIFHTMCHLWLCILLICLLLFQVPITCSMNYQTKYYWKYSLIYLNLTLAQLHKCARDFIPLQMIQNCGTFNFFFTAHPCSSVARYKPFYSTIMLLREGLKYWIILWQWRQEWMSHLYQILLDDGSRIIIPQGNFEMTSDTLVRISHTKAFYCYILLWPHWANHPAWCITSS